MGVNTERTMAAITDKTITIMKQVSEKDQLINDALKELNWVSQGGQYIEAKDLMKSYIIIKETLMLLRDND